MAGGAIGAHLLPRRVSPDALAIFGSANHYHLIHSLALLGVGALHDSRLGARWLAASALCFGAGIVFFCGSLYLRVLLDERAFGAPAFGGALFMLGWLMLIMAALRDER